MTVIDVSFSVSLTIILIIFPDWGCMCHCHLSQAVWFVLIYLAWHFFLMCSFWTALLTSPAQEITVFFHWSLSSVIFPRVHISSFYQTLACYSNLFSNSDNSSSKAHIWLENLGLLCPFFFPHILSHFILWHRMFHCRRAMAFCLNDFTLLAVLSNFTWITRLGYLLTMSSYLNILFLWCFVCYFWTGFFFFQFFIYWEIKVWAGNEHKHRKLYKSHEHKHV